MAERQPQQPPSYQERQRGEGIKGILPEKGPSTSQVLAIITLLPLGGFLLFLAGGTLVFTLIGLAVTTPLFVICSPVLVPAAIVLGLAVIGFLASGAFGITALSSLSWMLNYLRSLRRAMPTQQMEQAKRRAQETAGQMGQRTREMGQTAQSKAQDVTRGQEGK